MLEWLESEPKQQSFLTNVVIGSDTNLIKAGADVSFTHEHKHIYSTTAALFSSTHTFTLRPKVKLALQLLAKKN